jgi:putative tryptophan/tyrosine transport system substrate-binding protein
MTESESIRSKIDRRAFITALASAAGAPVFLSPRAARAQQGALPVIGFLDPRTPEFITERLREFRRGLKETGYVEGENVSIVYRYAENDVDRLPALAAELVRRPVAVIVTSGGPGVAIAAKAATTTIPVVFAVGEDPVRLGLASSLARPGGNLTGVNFLNVELTAKRLELLRELVPAAARVAVLVNPANPASTQGTLRDLEGAARGIGVAVQAFNASSAREIDAAFAASARERIDALLVGQEAFFSARRLQLANMAARHALPLISASREITEAGGLMSYGTNILDVYRQLGLYTGRILKGAKPADLPVEQSAKFELVINAQTARMLGITVPPTLLATADDVIE